MELKKGVTPMNDVTIPTTLINNTINKLREDMDTGWALSDVLTVVEEAGYDKSVCKDHILHEYFGIPDEVGYIDDSIKKARKQKMIVALFDTPVEETIKNVSASTNY
jgi:hypothetical protein